VDKNSMIQSMKAFHNNSLLEWVDVERSDSVNKDNIIDYIKDEINDLMMMLFDYETRGE
jgi:hypothetical protein